MTSDLTGAVSQARCTCFVDQAAGLLERLSTLDTAMKSTTLQELFSMRSNARVYRRRDHADQHTVRDVGRMVHPARNLIAVVGNAADSASNGVFRHRASRPVTLKSLMACGHQNRTGSLQARSSDSEVRTSEGTGADLRFKVVPVSRQT